VKAFVLADPQGQIRDRDQLDLYDGYLALCYDTKLVTASDIYSNKEKITRDDIFCGHVQLCQYIWKQLKVADPCIPNYPEELKEYFGRSIRKMKFYQFRNLLKENEEFGNIYFVKPVKNKLFTGFTCVTEQECLSKTNCSPETDVYVSSYVNFGAEFRAYVYKGKVVDCFRYWGDDWKVTIPHMNIEEMVSKLNINAVFYSLDVGIDIDKKQTLLMEVNDGYALGNYGLAPVDYARYSAERWREIMKDPLDVDPSKWSKACEKMGCERVDF
jgi:hypothetical protein